MPAPDVLASDWRARWLAIVSKLAVHHDGNEVRGLMSTAKASQKPMTIAFVNAHAMNMVVESPEFFRALMSADVLLRDGIGLAILMRTLGREPGLNLNGTDFIPRLLGHYKADHVALYGTQDEFLQAASAELKARGHVGALTCVDGFQQPVKYTNAALSSQPDVVVLGMGMPKQEAVAESLRSTLTHPTAILCGGAIIDFLGGKVSRAPRIVRTMGLEWLYRLCLEPKRLFNRYVVGNPLFILRVLLTVKADMVRNRSGE